MTALPPIPLLETPRLRLRPLELRDAPAVQRLFPQWGVVRWLNAAVPWPYPADGAVTHITKTLAEQVRMVWAITLKGVDELRGQIDLWPEQPGKRDMRGFWLDPELHGEGLMLEAANAVTGYAFEVLDWPRLYLTNAVENRASARIKEKQGAVEIDREEADYFSGRTMRQVWLLTPETWRKPTYAG